MFEINVEMTLMTELLKNLKQSSTQLLLRGRRMITPERRRGGGAKCLSESLSALTGGGIRQTVAYVRMRTRIRPGGVSRSRPAARRPSVGGAGGQVVAVLC